MIPTISKSVVLAAYTVLPMSIRGSVFSCAAADAAFKASFDGEDYIDMQQGWTMDSRPTVFNKITFYNPSARQVAVTFYCGSSSMFYSPPVTLALVSNAGTYLKGSGIQAPARNSTTPYSGVDGTKNRKQFILTNMSGEGMTLYINDADGNLVLPVFDGQSRTLEISSMVKLENPNGVPVNCVVGEVFYA